MTTVDEARRDAPAIPVRGASRAAIAARALVRMRTRWVNVLAWAGALAAVGVVAAQASAGLDPSDEAFYLQAVTAPGREDAFNGFFGLYLRPLWALAGWDVARVRLLGLAVLVAVAVLLGLAVARLSGRPRATLVAMSVAASTGYYASTWRIPSYNWLALVGAVLVCTGLLRLLAGGRPGWGVLCGLGVAVAAGGKLPTAALLAVLVAVTARRRRAALAWAAGVLAVTVATHLLVVLPPAQTARLVRRTAAMLAAVSPDSYSPAGAVTAFASGWCHATLAGVMAGGVVGLLPLALAPRGPGRSAWFRPVCLTVVAASVVLALTVRGWSGGTSEVDRAAGLLPVLLAVVTASALATRLGLTAPAPRRWSAGSAVLGLAAAACAFGSNTLLGSQLNTMTLLLAPACVLACGALDRPVATSPRSGAVGLLVVALCAGSPVTALEAHADPRASAPLADANTPLVLGPVTVHTDADTARQVLQVETAARAAGWRPGTPLVDTTFRPVLPLALGARVPPVLLPAVPGYDLATVCQAVRGLGPEWRNAWLVVPPGVAADRARQLASYLGRDSPDDYVPVTTFSLRWAGPGGTLLRPRFEALPTAGGAQRTGSCLAR